MAASRELRLRRRKNRPSQVKPFLRATGSNTRKAPSKANRLAATMEKRATFDMEATKMLKYPGIIHGGLRGECVDMKIKSPDVGDTTAMCST